MSLKNISPERRHEIASKGGKALRPEQRSFSQSRELAREAGRKGGLTPRRTKSKLTSSELNTLADDIVANVPREA
jgi:general stress protein YciG